MKAEAYSQIPRERYQYKTIWPYEKVTSKRAV